MNMQVEHSEFPTELVNFFKSTIVPLKMAIGTCFDEHLNFHFKHSNISEYKDQNICVYEIPCLMRILLSKTNVISEDSIIELFADTKKEFCFILEWGKKKTILIFSILEATSFADHQFTKDLTNKRELLLNIVNSMGQVHE